MAFEQPKRRGRPPKEETGKPDNAAAAVATPAAADAGQADVLDSAQDSPTSAAPVSGGTGDGRTFTAFVKDGMVEAVVENPTTVPYAVFQQSPESSSSILQNTDFQQNAQSADGKGSLSIGQESPIEEKIHRLVESQCPQGWHPIDTAPQDGNRIVVSETGDDQLAVYWRIRRVVDRKNLRYIKKGAWTSFLSRMDIDFEPKYWRPYNNSDYMPWPRKA